MQSSQDLESRLKSLRMRFAELRGAMENATEQAADDIQAEFEDVAQQLADAMAEQRESYQRQADEVKSALDTAWKRLATQTEQSRQMTAREIEAIRSRWNMAFMNLQTAHREHVQHLQKELDRMERDLAKVSRELNTEVTAKREAARLAYEQRARQMRDSYRSYIRALQQEVERITTTAATASSENRSRMMKKVDEINTKSNAAYEKVHHNFNRMAAKARAYLLFNRERLEQSEGEIRGRIERQMDAITGDLTELRAEMVASMEAYNESLENQAEALSKRIQLGGAEATAMAAKLDARRKQAESQLAEAYRSYAMSIENEIRRIERAGADISPEAREKLENLRSELARIPGNGQ